MTEIKTTTTDASDAERQAAVMESWSEEGEPFDLFVARSEAEKRNEMPLLERLACELADHYFEARQASGVYRERICQLIDALKPLDAQKVIKSAFDKLSHWEAVRSINTHPQCCVCGGDDIRPDDPFQVYSVDSCGPDWMHASCMKKFEQAASEANVSGVGSVGVDDVGRVVVRGLDDAGKPVVVTARDDA
jgi:hypothetical protein